MDKLIRALEEILPGHYSWVANAASLSFSILWEGKLSPREDVERAATCKVSEMELINCKDTLELAYQVRNKLINDLTEIDPDLIMDIILGKA